MKARVRLGIRQACLAVAAQLRGQARLRQGFGEPRRSASCAKAAFTTAAAVVICSPSLLACPVCFGAEETPMINGAKLGVLLMLAILFAVQGGFVGFFLFLR